MRSEEDSLRGSAWNASERRVRGVTQSKPVCLTASTPPCIPSAPCLGQVRIIYIMSHKSLI